MEIRAKTADELFDKVVDVLSFNLIDYENICAEIINANIKFLGLKEVTSPIPFERGAIPTIDGLFSEVIFGVTQEERRKTWGYINLGTKVFHPYVYEVLTSVQQNIASVCRGEKSWKVTDKHDLVEVKENDPDYDENNTGMDWMVANYPKIVFKKKSITQRRNINLLAFPNLKRFYTQDLLKLLKT